MTLDRLDDDRERRFSPWLTLDAHAGAPTEPGIIQVKLLGPLLVYPRGMSQMVHYLAGSNCRTLLDAAVCEAAVRGTGDAVRWRWLGSEAPERDLARLLARFEARFGAPPAWPEPSR